MKYVLLKLKAFFLNILRRETTPVYKLVVVCAGCGKVRSPRNIWVDLKMDVPNPGRYVSHGLCPKCVKTLYPQYYCG